MFSKAHNLKRIFRNARTFCSTSADEIVPGMTWDKFKTLPHRKAMNIYLGSHPHIEDIRHYIPQKYISQKKHVTPDNLYLIDTKIAKDIAQHVLPSLRECDRMICETNPGLGLLTSELLDGGLKRIRLYETCSDFRMTLKGFNEAYPSRVELFVKDFFHMPRMSYMDKIDKGSRVSQFLKGVSIRNWSDEPVLTVIGTMPKLDFLSYLFKMISFQMEIGTYGRIELFVVMKPKDYSKLIAGPGCNSFIYQWISILSNTFCECTLLEKYSRFAFLPWESFSQLSKSGFMRKTDSDKLYFVHVKMKDTLPLPVEELMPFYIFVRQLYGRGGKPIIEKLEKWIAGIGKDVMFPNEPVELLEKIDIFTKARQVDPPTFVELFKVLRAHPQYSHSSLPATIDSELLKYETVETEVTEVHEPSELTASNKT